MGMRDALGMEDFKINNVTYTDADLAALPLDKLEELKVRVNSDILAINDKLKASGIAEVADRLNAMAATPEASPEGARSPAEWLIRLRHAMSQNQRFLPYLSHIIKKRQRQARGIEFYFVDLARESMDAKDFQYLLSEARARYEASQQG